MRRRKLLKDGRAFAPEDVENHSMLKFHEVVLDYE